MRKNICRGLRVRNYVSYFLAMTKNQIKVLVKVWASSILTHHEFAADTEWGSLADGDLEKIQNAICELAIKIGGDLPTFTGTDDCIKYVRENIK